ELKATTRISPACQTAVICAKQLLEKVCEQTQKNDWSLSLGVGIHRGRAVVGSIGSAARRDFTAVGHTVNLASRLCDKAGPWQITVSEDLFTVLPPADQAQFDSNPPTQFKNVTRPVTTYTFTLPQAAVNLT